MLTDADELLVSLTPLIPTFFSSCFMASLKPNIKCQRKWIIPSNPKRVLKFYLRNDNSSMYTIYLYRGHSFFLSFRCLVSIFWIPSTDLGFRNIESLCPHDMYILVGKQTKKKRFKKVIIIRYCKYNKQK